ncbi:hypothetical protein [Staphylococcus pettenkoferi]|uniref:hypothetical protein n=1 Tax=Staphylococcus pettenkoferi TaxID=170573 RepID=UPI0011A6CA9A|nr:hypothetical protein [Staphylococcus pettenkoferi]MCI2802796.1 hypothetical protein [Staphylococcus pettenkoferi]
MHLIMIFIFSLVFVLFFKVQKNLFPSSYFAFSYAFLEHEKITVKKYFSRICVIVIYNTFSYLILHLFFSADITATIILSSNFLGSFLILWPLILYPKENFIELPSKKAVILLVIIYVIFIFSVMIIALLTLYLIITYVSDANIFKVLYWNKEAMLLNIISIPCLAILEKIFTDKC